MRNLRLYMLVGGMPQAVNEYLDTNNLSKTDAVKREIIELYLDDFRKIDKTGRAAKLFESIPSELNKNSARYQVASVLDDAGRKNLMGVLADMKDSMVVNFAYHANDPNVGFFFHYIVTKTTIKCLLETQGYSSHLLFGIKTTRRTPFTKSC